MNSQINAKLVTRLIGTALFIAFAAESLAASPSTETRSTIVKFADLNLNSPEGIAALYTRLHRAAEQVCDTSSGDSVFSEVRLAQKQCVRESEARAVDSIHNAALAAYYSKKTGTPMPILVADQK
jgi:UrcA family protein